VAPAARPPRGGSLSLLAARAHPDRDPGAAPSRQIAREADMLVADITRAETGERARLVRVQSYDVALDLTRGPEIFGSASVIRFDCREPEPPRTST
jgi:hypothetical protein